ncbi:MAG: polysaccharide deacetylase family protein [Bacteroidota bacterium]
MLLYVEHNNPRLAFVIQFLNTHFLAEEAIITDKSDLFQNSKYLRLNYSHRELDCDIHVQPEGMLIEEVIRDYSDPFSSDISERMKGDIFSRIFYSLSRYEEYQIQERDEHGRFSDRFLSAELKKQKKTPYLDKAIIDFFQKLENKHSLKLLKPRTFNLVCTFDIDIAYAYRGRSALRNLASRAKNFVNSRHTENRERKQVLSGIEKDPFDTYAFLKEAQQKYRFNFRYFFLLSKRSKFDLGLNPQNEELRSLVQQITEYAQVGLHPSYLSHKSFQKLEEERNCLEGITGATCSISRQHYLKFQLPETYRQLIQLGIKEDYSMGFSDSVSCRAGTAFPFLWFDLEKNESTDLLIYPLHFMDSTFIYSSDKTEGDAEKELFLLMKVIKDQGGNFIMNWHNNHLGDTERFFIWRELFEKVLSSASNF